MFKLGKFYFALFDKKIELQIVHINTKWLGIDQINWYLYIHEYFFVLQESMFPIMLLVFNWLCKLTLKENKDIQIIKL